MTGGFPGGRESREPSVGACTRRRSPGRRRSDDLGSGQCSAEDARRKHALEIMSMPRRYSANARLLRVARICGNQAQRMSRYLRGRPSSGPRRYEKAWDLTLQYNPAQEGA